MAEDETLEYSYTPSPSKSHSYPVMVPSLSVMEAVNWTCRGAVPEAGDALKDETAGATLDVVKVLPADTAVFPALSVETTLKL